MNLHPRPRAEVVDSKRLRQVLGSFATGVTVVTVGGPAPHGMTANAFASVSLEPPLVLVCVDRNAVMHAALLESGLFGISVLASDQERVARHFADRRRPLGREQFRIVDCVPGAISGAPLIGGAAAHLECELLRTYDGGDHTIFLAALLSTVHLAETDVLLFVQGKFRSLDREGSQLPT